MRRRGRPRPPPPPPYLDRPWERGDDAPFADLGHPPVAEFEGLGEVVPGVDVDDREWETAGPEGLLGQTQQDDRILATAEEDRRPLEDGRSLAEDVDRLGLELGEVRQAVTSGRRRAGHRAPAATASSIRGGAAGDSWRAAPGRPVPRPGLASAPARAPPLPTNPPITSNAGRPIPRPAPPRPGVSPA